MQEESMQKLHKKLKEYEITKEVLEDINDIEIMIENGEYEKDTIIGIESKYSLETNFLMKFENSDNIGFDINYTDPTLQVLKNLRDRLYIIAVYRVLKEDGKEVTKKIMNMDYEELLELIEE